MTSDHARDEESREHWQSLIDNTLIEWALDPSQLDDEGIEPPARQTTQQAIILARKLRDEGLPAPDSLVPAPDGGIVFACRGENTSEEWHIWDDETVEYLRFHDWLERPGVCSAQNQ
jgi:hypothetical protein